MKKEWFRRIGLGIGITLGLFAAATMFAEATRPYFHTSDFFRSGPRPPPQDAPATAVATLFSIDGDFLADYGTAKARQALEMTSINNMDRAAENKAAGQALVSALAVSPIRSATWLMLAMLKSRMGEPSEKILQMSYLTGPLPLDAAITRIQTVTTASIVSEDLRLLAGSDIRTILMHDPDYVSTLMKVYKQATPDGKTFLLEATQPLDPRLAGVLKRTD